MKKRTTTPKATITREHFAALVLARLASLVTALVAVGWPALSEWWTQTLTSFVQSGARQLVARVGRRGGKSSTACVFAVAFALVYSTLKLVPPGDIGWVVFVSVRREEALSRLATIQAILRAIGVSFVLGDGDAIIIEGKNCGFRVQACTVAAVTGWTSILIIADELSKWSEASNATNPATEVLASLRPTMATQPFAFVFLISSPFTTEDAHAKAFDLGNTTFQMVVHAATWIANPTITEADTRELEPDERIWSREFAAIPGQASSAAFDADLVRPAVRDGGPFTPYPPPLWLLDLSAGKGDSIATALAQRFVREDGRECIRIGSMLAFEGRAFRKDWTFDQTIDFFASKVKGNASVRRAVSDGYNDYALEGALRRHGIEHTSLSWTADSKAAAVALVRKWLRDRILYVETGAEADKWIVEMNSFEEKLLPSGVSGFGSRRGGHDDRVALCINLAMAEIAGIFSRAPAPIACPPPMLRQWDAEPADFSDLDSSSLPIDVTIRKEIAKHGGHLSGESAQSKTAVTAFPSFGASANYPFSDNGDGNPFGGGGNDPLGGF